MESARSVLIQVQAHPPQASLASVPSSVSLDPNTRSHLEAIGEVWSLPNHLRMYIAHQARQHSCRVLHNQSTAMRLNSRQNIDLLNVSASNSEYTTSASMVDIYRGTNDSNWFFVHDRLLLTSHHSPIGTWKGGGLRRGYDPHSHRSPVLMLLSWCFDPCLFPPNPYKTCNLCSNKTFRWSKW